MPASRKRSKKKEKEVKRVSYDESESEEDIEVELIPPETEVHEVAEKALAERLNKEKKTEVSVEQAEEEQDLIDLLYEEVEEEDLVEEY